MDWNQIWGNIKNFFVGNGWAILGFFVTLIFGLIIIKIIIKSIKKILSKTKMEKIAQKFLMSILKVSLYLILVIILLAELGISITGIVAALSAAVLAIGLALQNSLSNLANGIIIISGKMFKEGDYISVNGIEGTVKNINLLATTVVTSDNKSITLPNSDIVNNPTTNYDAFKKRRVDIFLDISYDTDIEKAKSIILDVAKSDGRIYLDPAPTCKIKALQSNSIQLVVNAWVDSEDYWDVYYYLIDKIFNEFKKNKVKIPFNQIEVRMRNDKVSMPYDKKPLPERKEKERPLIESKNLFDIVDEKLNKKIKSHSKKGEKRLSKLQKKKEKNGQHENEHKKDKSEDNLNEI